MAHQYEKGGNIDAGDWCGCLGLFLPRHQKIRLFAVEGAVPPVRQPYDDKIAATGRLKRNQFELLAI